MRAALLREVDGPFELVDMPEPTAGGGKVRVHVRAAGVNFLDVMVRHGRYPQMPELPAVLGVEVAGELEDGTRVMALCDGGYAEVVAADPAQIVPLPEHASFAEGAAFLMTFLTAFIPLTRQVRIGPGSRVLVTAAAGGVGSAAIQIARGLGATVVGAVGSQEKIETCLELGAERAHLYGELPDDETFDVILDQVGGDFFGASFARLRPLGTVVAVGSAAGAWPAVDPARIVGRNVSLAGFYLGRLIRLDPELIGSALGELLAFWQTGALRPLVGAEVPLDEVERAHELVESRRSVGKVVLVP
ncbi:MAG: zinc-binding dehydrogenase [Actinomycetota bacterium]